MIDIKIQYNGKAYKDIEKAFFDATVNGIKESMNEKLKPFKSQIAQEGGQVIIKITGHDLKSLGGQLEIKNISSELKDKINSYLK